MALKKEHLFAFFLFGLLGLIIESTQASVKSGVASDNGSLELVKKQVSEQRSHIEKLKSEINELESNLGQGNKRYVSIVENKQNVEASIYKVRENLEAIQAKLDSKKNKVQEVLTQTVLNKLNTENDPAQILADKILIKGLSKEIKMLEKRARANQNSQEQLEKLQVQFQEYAKTEVELATFLNELEHKKKTVVDNYLGERKKEKKLEKRYSKLKVQFAMARAQAKKREGLSFMSPIREFTNFEHGKKGVTFHFDGRKPVMSSGSGEVVYSGELSTYGNIVMIDHGDETRSVVLGEFIPKVKKGLKVKSGDVLGYTSYNPRREVNKGKVYFEVRKENKVQNTIELMDPRSLEKEVLASR